MINRLDDYLPAAEPTTSADVARRATGSSSPDLGRMVAQVETWIIAHPGVSLASAFVLGAALAWWIKAQVNGSSGRAEAPPRTVARNTGELLEDLLTLAELQVRLLMVDLQQGLWRLALPAAAIAAASLVALGCVPVALAAIALCLDETTSLTLAQSFGLSVLGGIVLAALLAAGGWAYLRHRLDILERSRTEWRQNGQWVRSALKRFGSSASRQKAGTFPPSNPR